MAEVEPRQREIAELIIGNLNPDGFLVATPEEIRAMGDRTADWAEDASGMESDLDATSFAGVAGIDGIGAGDSADPEDRPRRYGLDEVEAALELVRSFDPPGIACNDLRESLMRQMDFRGVPARKISPLLMI